MRLGVDPRKADQMVRGTVNLPNGTGKTARVIVFATGAQADAAREAGADEVGDDELIERVAGGWTDFDAAVATPNLMGKVGRLGRVLGPRGLMPNPKTGTVTMDTAKAVSDIKGGKIEFRTDRAANLQYLIGKVSFTEQQLAENYVAALDEVLRLKPSASKGRYITKITVSTTMGPGIPVDVNRPRNRVEETDEACPARRPASGVTRVRPRAFPGHGSARGRTPSGGRSRAGRSGTAHPAPSRLCQHHGRTNPEPKDPLRWTTTWDSRTSPDGACMNS